MKKIPPIKSVMSPFPYWIDIQEPLIEAEKIMIEHDISHLPVKERGDIVAVIASFDIEHAKSNPQFQNKFNEVLVQQVCVMNPYIVDMDEPLDNVLLHLSNHHIGSAIVMKGKRLAGVFTVNDACRGFADFLRSQFRNLGGDDIA